MFEVLVLMLHLNSVSDWAAMESLAGKELQTNYRNLNS